MPFVSDTKLITTFYLYAKNTKWTVIFLSAACTALRDMKNLKISENESIRNSKSKNEIDQLFISSGFFSILKNMDIYLSYVC